MTIDSDSIIGQTRDWLTRAVIGLNLCPFAKSVHVKEQIRYVVSDAATPEQLVEHLVTELSCCAMPTPKKSTPPCSFTRWCCKTSTTTTPSWMWWTP